MSVKVQEQLAVCVCACFDFVVACSHRLSSPASAGWRGVMRCLHPFEKPVSSFLTWI